MTRAPRRRSGPLTVGSPQARPTYLSVRDVAITMQRSPRTIRDWILHGCPTAGGLVRLDAAKFGKTWQVKDEWLLVFEHRVRSRVPERPNLELEEKDRETPCEQAIDL